MADRKITDLTALAAGSQATGDLVTIVDVSESAAADKNKKMTMENLFKGIPGDVGIGVSSPAAKLEVQGGATSSAIAAHIKAGDGGSTVGLIVDGDVEAGDVLLKARSNSSASPSDSDTKFIIQGDGNVGIGTASPTDHGSYGGTLEITGSPGGALYLKSSSDVGQLGMNSSGLQLRTRTAKDILFSTNNSERARIDSSGRLLVGHSSSRTTANALEPHFQMEGTNVSTSTAAIVRNENNANGPILALSKSRGTSTGSSTVVQSGDITGAIHFAGADGTDLNSFTAWIQSEVDGTPGSNDMPGRLTFYTTADGASSPTERVRIDSSGNILIGKTTASDVNAAGTEFKNDGQSFFSVASSSSGVNTLHVYSTTASAYRFYVGMNGTVHATNTTISAISDQRLKENIRDLDAGLVEILSLQPRRFDWKAGKGKDVQNDQGFIAQEFEQVFPEMVDEWIDPAPEGEEPYKSVRADLIPVLVNAIKELSAEVDTLKTKVAALEAQ